ncbi:MAG: SDR family NAD(P)-dependent oxidoreductase [Chitinophagaceae bacterium]
MYNHSFALITGASEGLGKYLAIECAVRNINLVLVALPGSRLKQLSQFIIKKYGVHVVCIEKDLSCEAGCAEVFAEVKAQGISIYILINNAGIGGTFFFDQRNTAYYSKVIALNVVAPTVLSRLFLEDLKKSGSSFIMNVSSLAGMFQLPKKQVYCGTKSYLIAFSKSLRKELKDQHISVSVLCPGGMNTSWQLTMDNRTTGTWISRQSILYPQQVAAIAIKKMLAKKEIIIPGLCNQLFLFLDRIIPKKLKNFLTAYQMNKTPQLVKGLGAMQPVPRMQTA